MSTDEPATPRPVMTPEQREPMKQAILGFIELHAHLDDWAIPEAPPASSGTPDEDAVLTAIDRALAARGLTIVPATCTCLHPGWPDTPCRLHPEARPLTREEGAEFARRFDERVAACHAARTPEQHPEAQTAEQDDVELPDGWITDRELVVVVDSVVSGLGAPTLGEAMKAVTAEVSGCQDQKLVYRLVKARIG